MDSVRPMSSPWPGLQGRSTILPTSSVIQSGRYHGSAVLTSKLKANKEKVDLFQQQARLTFRPQATSSPETEVACQSVLVTPRPNEDHSSRSADRVADDTCCSNEVTSFVEIGHETYVDNSNVPVSTVGEIVVGGVPQPVARSPPLTSLFTNNAPYFYPMPCQSAATAPMMMTSAASADAATRKRQIHLMKNREAARVCRQKKKEYIACLEMRVMVLESQNRALVHEFKSLRELYSQYNHKPDSQA